MKRISRWLSSKPLWFITALGLVMSIALCVADSFSVPDFSFSVCYLAPVMMVAWFCGRRRGVSLAIFAATAWSVADRLSAGLPAHLWVIPFNFLAHVGVLVIVALLAAAMRDLIDRSEERVLHRTALLEKEIAERKRAEEEARASEIRFRQLAENIREVFWMTNTDKSQMIYISPGYETIWGRPCSSLYESPRSWLDAIVPEDRARVTSAAATQFQGKYDLNYRIMRPDGSIRWIRDRGFPVYDDKKNIYRIAGIAEDITEQKEAEDALHKSDLQLRLVWERSLDGMRLIDENGTFVAVNEAYSQLVELPRTDLIGKSLSRIFTPEHRENGLRRFQERFHARSVQPLEERELTLWNGKKVFLEITNSFLETKNEPTLLLSIFRDVTERKHAEAALRQTEERFRMFMDITAIIAFIKDDKGKYIYANQSFQTRCPVPVVGKTGFDLFPPEVASRLLENDRAVLEAGRTLEFTDSITFPDGTVSDWLNFKFPLKDSSGRTFIGCVSVEITERRKLERQILEISEREQARIGHDLHDGLCQFLVSVAFDCNRLHERLKSAQRPESMDAAKIAALVDSAVTQARQLARGLYPVSLEANGLVSALEEFASSVTTRFRIHCSVECPQPVFVRDHTAGTHLYRVAAEAVHNAVRHAAPSKIVIGLRLTENILELSVTDDGVGLSRDPSAQGMGLHIMDYRTRTLGGALNISDTPGGGTTVSCFVELENVMAPV